MAEPIRLLEARLVRGTERAREMLTRLEAAMVRVGYVRDGIYNSRQAGWSGRRGRGTVLYWKGGKIMIGRGGQAKDGKWVPNPPVVVDSMTPHDLIRVADNLAPFLDSLEENVRWQVSELEAACAKIQAIIERVEANPQPSDSPAQMSEDVG